MKAYSDKDKIKPQKNLAVIRKIAGWTSEELGDLIGVTKQTISNLENNRSIMTKTQYIAIRTIIDCEISSNPDNVALAQLVNILLDSDDLSEEEQEKIDTTIAYVAGAKERGMSSEAIAAGLTALITALGLIINPATSAVVAVPMWMKAIISPKKK